MEHGLYFARDCPAFFIFLAVANDAVFGWQVILSALGNIERRSEAENSRVSPSSNSIMTPSPILSAKTTRNLRAFSMPYDRGNGPLRRCDNGHCRINSRVMWGIERTSSPEISINSLNLPLSTTGEARVRPTWASDCCLPRRTDTKARHDRSTQSQPGVCR